MVACDCVKLGEGCVADTDAGVLSDPPHRLSLSVDEAGGSLDFE